MGLFGKIKQGVTGKEYIDNFSCPRCGGRVYEKKYLYYCDSCGMLSAEESKKASRAYYSKYDTPETIALMQRKDELEEERRQEALACGDTRKVNGDDYFDYVDDWLNKYFCSPFSHANEGYSGYKMGHLDPEEEKRFGTIQLLKVDKFDGSRKIDEVRIYVIYKSIGVDKSQSNNERLVINFKDFRTIALDWNSSRNKGYTTAYGSVDDAYNYLEQQYYEAFEKHMYEIIKEDLYIYQCNYFGFDDITLDEIYFQFE